MTDLQTASYLLINGFHWYLYGLSLIHISEPTRP